MKKEAGRFPALLYLLEEKFRLFAFLVLLAELVRHDVVRQTGEMTRVLRTDADAPRTMDTLVRITYLQIIHRNRTDRASFHTSPALRALAVRLDFQRNTSRNLVRTIAR